MTTMFPREVTCAACGRPSTHQVLGSTNTFGSMDLDTRPPEMQRSTMSTWVQACPSCGYCWGNIAEAPPVPADFVSGQAYRARATDPGYPPLANRFLCQSLIQEQAGQLAGAGWSSLHAAWTCDDAGKQEGARACRLRAYQLFFSTGTGGQTFASDPGAEDAIVVDLLRRAGSFDEARSHCERGLAGKPADIIAKVFGFQLSLIDRGDTACHTVAEAVGGSG